MVSDIDDATDVNVCLGDEKITTCLKNGSQACTLVNVVAAVGPRFLCVSPFAYEKCKKNSHSLFPIHSVALSMFRVLTSECCACVCTKQR